MLNKSYSYLIPLLNEYCKIDGDYYVMLENVYTRHQDGDVGDIIILSYCNADNDDFKRYIEELKSNVLCQDFIETDDVISIVFKFPDEFIDEYEYYKTGKFSQFSQEAKDIVIKYILDTHKYKDAYRVKRVLNKEVSLREELEHKLAMTIDKDMELSSIPDKELETFYY